MWCGVHKRKLQRVAAARATRVRAVMARNHGMDRQTRKIPVCVLRFTVGDLDCNSQCHCGPVVLPKPSWLGHSCITLTDHPESPIWLN